MEINSAFVGFPFSGSMVFPNRKCCMNAVPWVQACSIAYLSAFSTDCGVVLLNIAVSLYSSLILSEHPSRPSDIIVPA